VDTGAHRRSALQWSSGKDDRVDQEALWKVFEGKRLSHEETLTLLAEAVQKINSRPITRNPRPEGEPLCVQDLMLGRAEPGQVEVKFETGKKANLTV
jgi:hypothetical protein